eukprot:CAMPEP_0180138960 /NCGR_PEP_ID=MMETSP0986-20121125/13242_1 /TAXON_ID=697907 /ORGANISM="non described non described, Strain CCMP2293" /LENGTH=79 /DNA_ID=CAMNT_0022080959 /DNA_START=242 /DNA_END=477 /DNA_ORIENTATION=-
MMLETKHLGPLGSSSSHHRRTPELVLQKGHASFRMTSRRAILRNTFQCPPAYGGSSHNLKVLTHQALQGYLAHKKLPPA